MKRKLTCQLKLWLRAIFSMRIILEIRSTGLVQADHDFGIPLSPYSATGAGQLTILTKAMGVGSGIAFPTKLMHPIAMVRMVLSNPTLLRWHRCPLALILYFLYTIFFSIKNRPTFLNFSRHVSVSFLFILFHFFWLFANNCMIAILSSLFLTN